MSFSRAGRPSTFTMVLSVFPKTWISALQTSVGHPRAAGDPDDGQCQDAEVETE